MAGIERFEDIIAWQKARHLTRLIYQVSDVGSWSRDFGLKDQTRRASVSIMSNIAEGFERGPREFHQFLTVAKGSCAEVRSLQYVALDAAHLSEPDFANLIARSEEVARLIGGLRAAVAESIANL